MFEGFTHEMGEGLQRAELYMRAWFRLRFIERITEEDPDAFQDTPASEQALKERVDRSVARFKQERHRSRRVDDEVAMFRDEMYEVGRGDRGLDGRLMSLPQDDVDSITVE